MHMIDIDNEINAFDFQTYKIKRYIDELGPLNTLDKDKEMEELAHE